MGCLQLPLQHSDQKLRERLDAGSSELGQRRSALVLKSSKSPTNSKATSRHDLNSVDPGMLTEI